MVLWSGLVRSSLIRWFLPRNRGTCRQNGQARGLWCRASGCDTITNIRQSNCSAPCGSRGIAPRLGAMQKFGYIAPLGILAAVIPVALNDTGRYPAHPVDMARHTYFWSPRHGKRGRYRAAGAVYIRHRAEDWLVFSFTLMAIYSNIGEIER